MKSAGTILLLAVIYFVSAKLGLRLAYVHESATAVWPPTGIALAALLLLGNRAWPGIWLGAFMANITTGGSLMANLTTAGSFFSTLGIATGNTLEGIAGAWLVTHFARGANAFDCARDFFKFVFLAAILATTISATIGVSSLALVGEAKWSNFGAIWLTWWLGDMVGAIIVAPLLMLWWAEPRIRWNGPHTVEAALLLASLVLAAQAIFGGWMPFSIRNYPLEFLCIPPLIWAAFRFGRREAMSAVVILAGIAIWGTLHSFGPFGKATPQVSLLLLQAFVGVCGVTALALAADVHERRQVSDARYKTDERFRQLAETIQEVFYVADVANGEVLYISPAFETVWGHTCYSLYKEPAKFLETILPEHRDRVTRALERQRRGELTEEEYEIRRADGTQRWIRDRAYPLSDATGRVYRVTGIAEDITERKRVMEALSKATDQVASILGTITDGFITFDTEWRIIYLNRPAEVVFSRLQKTPKDLLGKCFWDEFAYMKGTKLEEEFKRAVSQQTAVKFEILGPTSGVWFDIHAYPSTEGLAVYFNDITVRKRTENALRESEANARAMVESAMDCIVSMDHEGKITGFNPAAERTFGYKQDQVTGRYMADVIIPPSLRDQHRRGLERYLATGQASVLGRRIELKAMRADGTEFPIELAITRVPGKEPPVFTGFMRDITERVQMALAREQLAAIVESSDDAIISKTTTGVITSWNAGAARIFGYSAEEMIGNPMTILIPKDRLEEEAEILGRIMKGEDIEHFETVRVRKDGKHIDISATISPIKDANGTIIGASKIARDVTHQKLAEAHVRASLREKEVMLKEINHRVKNNLQVISSLLFLQSESTQDAALRELLEESRNRVRSMALVHEHLYRSPILSRIDFEEYVRKLATDLFRSYGARGEAIGLKINIPQVSVGIDAAIPCGLIINELVSNSLKYAFPDGARGEIGIDLLDEGDGMLRLVVRDNGIGFPEDMDFRQTTSLGMQIVASLTQQLKGTLQLQNRGGAQFRITFPKPVNEWKG